jgi:hypothetical protein
MKLTKYFFITVVLLASINLYSAQEKEVIEVKEEDIQEKITELISIVSNFDTLFNEKKELEKNYEDKKKDCEDYLNTIISLEQMKDRLTDKQIIYINKTKEDFKKSSLFKDVYGTNIKELINKLNKTANPLEREAIINLIQGTLKENPKILDKELQMFIQKNVWNKYTVTKWDDLINLDPTQPNLKRIRQAPAPAKVKPAIKATVTPSTTKKELSEGEAEQNPPATN